MKELKIKTPYSDKNWSFVKHVFDTHQELLEALRGLTSEIQLSKLNIRKDFSLINAHAYALRVIHKVEEK